MFKHICLKNFERIGSGKKVLEIFFLTYLIVLNFRGTYFRGRRFRKVSREFIFAYDLFWKNSRESAHYTYSFCTQGFVPRSKVEIANNIQELSQLHAYVLVQVFSPYISFTEKFAFCEVILTMYSERYNNSGAFSGFENKTKSQKEKRRNVNLFG